jgi:hypothetical protein
MSNNPVGKTTEGKTLNPDPAMPMQSGKKQTFATKKHTFEITGTLDVIFH